MISMTIRKRERKWESDGKGIGEEGEGANLKIKKNLPHEVLSSKASSTPP